MCNCNIKCSKKETGWKVLDDAFAKPTTETSSNSQMTETVAGS